MSLKSIIGSVVILFVLIFVGWYAFFRQTSTLNIELTSIKTHENTTITQLCNKLGTPLFINFWATWCPICRKDIPALSNLARHHANVVFVSNDYAIDTVEQFIAANDYTDLQMYVDPTGEASKALGVSGLPTTIKLDKNCQVVDKHVGPLDAGTIALFFDVPLKNI